MTSYALAHAIPTFDEPSTAAAPNEDVELRLALFTDTALPQLNGVTRTLDRLARAVRARGGEVLTLTTTDCSATYDPMVRRFPSLSFWAYPQLRIAAPNASEVLRELRAFGPTLVHAATPFGVGLAGRAAAQRMALPFVSSYHTSFSAYAAFYGLGMLSDPGWRYLRWFHNGGLRTYCPTRAVQHELESHGLRSTRLWGRGVDTKRFSPRHRSQAFRESRLGVCPDTIVVASVGRLAAEKGLDLALDAMQLMRERAGVPIAFAFAGDGPYAATCRAKAPAGTRFLGRLEGSELAALYASADLFVFPSRTDTFGNVLLEAMASGLPIVAADAPPTRELLRSGENGVLVPADAGAMADALVDLSIDARRRTELSVRGRTIAAQHSWDAVFDALLSDYAAVMRSARRGSARWLASSA
jgi:glycosyltransferase involved in cell wall biosynthesis